MGNHNPRRFNFQRTKAVLRQVEQIRLNLGHQSLQIGPGLVKIGLALLHPFQPEGCGVVVEAGEVVHPSNLVRQRDIAKAHERHAHTPAHQARDHFAGVGPGSGKRIGSEEDVHGFSWGPRRNG